MATANAKPALQSRPRRRRWPRAVLALLLIVGAALAWYWSAIMGYARTGASYGARVACSCRFEGGRSLEDCRKDFEPGMEMVALGEDAQARSVTARFPLLAKQTATYREGWGCVLEPWKE
jgi:hypothetical protein